MKTQSKLFKEIYLVSVWNYLLHWIQVRFFQLVGMTQANNEWILRIFAKVQGNNVVIFETLRLIKLKAKNSCIKTFNIMDTFV